jgi:hypothetical protein
MAMSPEPARTCPAAKRARVAARRRLGACISLSSPRRIQGIQAAPMKWWGRLTTDRNGPLATHAAAATIADRRDSPEARASRKVPAAANHA